MVVLAQADGGVRVGIHIDNSNTKVQEQLAYFTLKMQQSQTITRYSHLNNTSSLMDHTMFLKVLQKEWICYLFLIQWFLKQCNVVLIK